MDSFLGTVADTLKCENQMSAINDASMMVQRYTKLNRKNVHSHDP